MITPGVLILLAATLPFIARGWWQSRVIRAQRSSGRAQADSESLCADLAGLEDEVFRLKHTLDEIVQLYEITTEITRFLEVEAVFAAFSERIKCFFPFEDVRIIPPGQAPAEFKDYTIFPLRAGTDDLGALGIRGIREKDTEKFSIVAQQFLLGFKRVVLYQKVQELATHDSLTGALSRRYWFARCADELARSRRYGFYAGCLMIDVDHFKDLNDTYGHLVGDAILAAVAALFKDIIRSIDLLGKYGGEEFVLFLTETDAEQAWAVAERIRQAVQAAGIRAYDETITVTISIGIANFPDDAGDLDQLVDKADQSLYRAKNAGRNCTRMFSAGG